MDIDLSNWQLLTSLIGCTLICGLFGRIGAYMFFISFGMLMIFTIWANLINLYGTRPSDQPYQETYFVSKAEDDRLWSKVYPIDSMTDRDWKDYHLCRLHNVCVRRFAR